MIVWDDLLEYRRQGDGTMQFGTLIGSQGRIRFWRGISHLKELEEEIERRISEKEDQNVIDSNVVL